MNRRPLLVAAVVACFVVSACSGGSGGSSGAGGPSTTPATGGTRPTGPPSSGPIPGSTARVRASSSRLYEAACNGSLAVSAAGTIEADDITELSGIVAGRSFKDGLWVHNDSGNDPQLFAVADDGTLVGTFTPKGADNTDWEDIGMGPAAPDADAASIYLADIGDNAKARPEIVLYRVPEPKVTRGGTAEPRPDQVRTIADTETITVRYPDGPHNAEAFFIDPRNGDGVIVTKEEDGPAAIYVAKAASLRPDATVTLERAGTVSFGDPSLATQVTGADISPSGDVIAIRTYGSVSLFERTADQSIAQALSGRPCSGPTPPKELQGEAVGFASDGQSYFTAAEGKNPELHQTKPG